ncbi:hypothetical protein LCGC14_2197370 [marine sediment metagenome]|uniref:Uncharacterized protein n=1 Tax=marine sediment metagenome TaxID=412755 RepID=A0A0F9E4V1_9ZZZZ|nr:hypothetical protein [bacterium]
MIKINICKAAPIKVETRPVTIVINKNLPTSEVHPGALEITMEEDAAILAGVLFGTLPQGTLERLVIHLLKKRVSIYRGVTRS